MRRTLLFVFCLVAAPAAVHAQRNVLVNWRNFTPHELRSAAFTLASPQEIEIDAVGANADRPGLLNGDWFDDDGRETRGWRGNAWILDARTRNVVWELESANTDGGRNGMERFDGKVRLPAGTYEVYFASYSGSMRLRLSDLGDLIRGDDPMDSRDWKDEGESEDFRLAIRGTAQTLNAAQVAAARGDYSARTVVSMTRPGPETTRRIGLTVSKPTAVEIYAIGEASEGTSFDYGWLVDADTHERLWRMTYEGTQHAGGADKNRVARWRHTLPAGRYIVAFVTDDSHDATDWNSAPPSDPDYAGLTMLVANAADKANVKTAPYEPPGVGEAIAAIVRVGDDEMREAGFTLTQPMGVRIHALGEGSGDMVDYGWIVNARTGRRVWTMDYDDTEHAGGASKNRLAEETIRLEPGDYIVHYRSDDSHSYDDWNAGPPMDGEYWGIVLFPANGKLDPAVVKPFDESRNPAIAARLTRMGDNERRRVRFTLDAAADVRVYAIGEGSGGDMYDYAWIEDDRTGRAVWEMTYRTTEHAGGADKNRVFDGTVRLQAGEYVLHYESDGSHSYEDWNSTPPDDPTHWGVTVYREVRRN